MMLKLGVFLLLGVVVNVAVAWMCVLWMPVDTSPTEVFETWVEGRQWWTKYSWFDNEVVDDLPTVEARSLGVHLVAHGADLWGVQIWRGGCPAPALECAIEFLEPTKSTHRCAIVPSWLPKLDADRNFVPLKVVPLGFAINTVFYAAILWLLWVAPGGGIGPVCSECGEALPAAWSTNAS
jgi:hypothetical protein